MGKNPEIIKTITAHTKQEKHVMFKEEIQAPLKAVICVFQERKETSKSKATAIKDLLSSSLAERKNLLINSALPGEIMGGGKS